MAWGRGINDLNVQTRMYVRGCVCFSCLHACSLCRFENIKLSGQRLAYVTRIWENRDAAAAGDNYYLEVWTDESYLHHWHHFEFGWVGELPEDLYPALQHKGVWVGEGVSAQTCMHTHKAPTVQGEENEIVPVLALTMSPVGKRYIIIDAFWTVPHEQCASEGEAKAGFVQGARKIWRPDVEVRNMFGVVSFGSV
jgi:hypothetical protein